MQAQNIVEVTYCVGEAFGGLQVASSLWLALSAQVCSSYWIRDFVAQIRDFVCSVGDFVAGMQR